MLDRLRTAATTVATVALISLGAAALPSAGAAASSSGSAATAEPEQGTLAGVNDWTCAPTPQHPRPVVLVHGVGASMQKTWGGPGELWGDPPETQHRGPLVEQLAADGYCVFALNHGATQVLQSDLTWVTGWGTGDIEGSARELAGFVDGVLERTGAAQVDIVGHSMGGTVARQYLRFEGGVTPDGSTVHTLVLLGPTTHGTTFGGTYPTALAAATAPKAVRQQVPGSSFLTKLNAGQETFPGIDYTVIATTKDASITPYQSSFLVAAPGTSVRNVYVQDVCQDPDLAVGHARDFGEPGADGPGLIDHPVPLFLVRQALDPALSGGPPC
jgi:pimeloyl-ACP methyl ester carboxylesterase